jgi:hypothetical protein
MNNELGVNLSINMCIGWFITEKNFKGKSVLALSPSRPCFKLSFTFLLIFHEVRPLFVQKN